MRNQATITLRYKDGTTANVEADLVGALGIHRMKSRNWQLTHAPSGAAVGLFRTKTIAAQCRRALFRLPVAWHKSETPGTHESREVTELARATILEHQSK